MNKSIRYIIASSFWICCFTAFFAGTVKAQIDIGISIAEATVTEQDTFTIAVKADSLLTGKGIYSFRLGLSYDANYLEFLNIDSVGDILNNWGIPTFNKNKSGQIIIAGAGSTALTGQGNMLYLKFKAIRANYWTQLGNISGQSYLNEGSPTLATNFPIYISMPVLILISTMTATSCSLAKRRSYMFQEVQALMFLTLWTRQLQ